MAPRVTHTKVSSVPDGADTSVVRPSDWNADHTLTGVQGTLTLTTTGSGAATLVGDTLNIPTPSDTGITQLTGDVTAGPGSGSQAATVVKINGVTLSGLATGILKNTTGTGQPSIAVANTDYQSPITLTTTGSSGAATFNGTTLNIPTYASASTAVTAVSVASANGLAGSSSGGTTPALTLSTTITGILKGNGTAISAAVAGTDYEVPLTFSTGLTRTVNTVTVNSSQSISKLTNLTSNGLVTTSSGDGTLGVTVPGTGVLTALGVNTGTAGAFVVNGGALGTPSSGTATNLTGTASGLTAGNVTTNANLTGVITSVGNATSIASQTGTGTKFVVDTAPTITGGSTDVTALSVKQTSNGSPTADIFNVTNNGATVKYLTIDNNGAPIFASKASSDLTVVYNATTAGQAAQFLLRDGGTDKWYLRKTTGNQFDIFSSVLSAAVFQANDTGFVQVKQNFGRTAPVTKSADFTVAASENWLINNKSGSTCTVTMPSAASFPGREIMFKNNQAQTVVSNASNIVPQAGGAAGTALLASGTSHWATVVSDGTNWVIMQSA